MKTRYVIAPIVMLAMLALAAFSTPAMAFCPCAVETHSYCAWGTSGTINGTVYVGGGEDGGPSEGFNVPEGNIKWAQVYWLHSAPSYTTVEFCNATSCTNNIVHFCCQSIDEGWYNIGESAWSYWNVTDIVTNGYNNIAVLNAYSRLQVLVVVLENDTYPGISYWVNQGYENLPDGGSGTTWFYGPADNTRNGTLWNIATCGNALIRFNGHLVTDVSSAPEYKYFLKANIPAHWIELDGDQKVTWSDVWIYYRPTLAIFTCAGPGSPEPGPADLTVSELYTSPETPNPGEDYILHATIQNWGGVSSGVFNVSLEVNGSPYGDKVTDVGPLAANESATVSFMDVYLPYGCHEFKVVADCDNNVNEGPYENNNVLSAYYQVGYVIVVRSNSDFDELVWEGLAREDGDTYYIENLNITNCAGHGITIENTDVPFVINNCTVQNCGFVEYDFPYYFYNGIYLNNVTNGKIKGCTITDNSDRGIRVKNSTYVDITNNTVQDNWYCGIEVCPRFFDPAWWWSPYLDDSKFINITNNTIVENNNYYELYTGGIQLIGFNCTVKDSTIQDNAGYGIHMCGNYSKIYNNTIENNDDYGIKLYNSSGNCIYGNTFINNKDGAVQANDTWKHHPEYAFNHWNSTVKLCYYNGTGIGWHTIGNNWSDYAGSDDDNDKIGDAAYDIDGATAAKDNSPLMEPWANLNAHVKCGDVDGNGLTNSLDGKIVAGAVPGVSITTCNWAADVDCNDLTNSLDGKIIAGAILGVSKNCCDPCCVR